MDKKETEIWRVLPSNENYLISDLGRVQVLPRLSKTGRKFKGKICKLHIGNNGYLRVGIGQKMKRVHQLVAEAFLDHAPCGYHIVVDHINNVSTDNRLSNLQIITQRENSSKDRVGGTSSFTGVSWSNQMNKWRSDIVINGKQKYLGCFHSEEAAAEAYQNALNDFRNG